MSFTGTDIAFDAILAKGDVSVDTGGRMPVLEGRRDVAKLDLNPYMPEKPAVAGLTTGTGTADISVTGRGKSQREIVGALNGEGSVTFRDGAIRGINLGAMTRNVASAFLDAQAGRAQQTDFAELVADLLGQGGSQQSAGIAVPVRLRGPWSNIAYEPDLSGAIQNQLRNPGAAADTLRNLLPGSRQQGTPPQQGTPQPGGPLNPLRNLLGR